MLSLTLLDIKSNTKDTVCSRLGDNVYTMLTVAEVTDGKAPISL